MWFLGGYHPWGWWNNGIPRWNHWNRDILRFRVLWYTCNSIFMMIKPKTAEIQKKLWFLGGYHPWGWWKKQDPVVETPVSQLIWIQSALVDSKPNFHEDIAKDNQNKAKNVIFRWLPPLGGGKITGSRGGTLGTVIYLNSECFNVLVTEFLQWIS